MGCGPQLHFVGDMVLEGLKFKPTIALNNAAMKLWPRYVLSAHMGQIIMAKKQIDSTGTIIHMRREPGHLVDDVITVQRSDFRGYTGLPKRFGKPVPMLYTDQNAALAATHLAIILGAKEIVYVAIEQNNKLHFYDLNPQLRETLKAAWTELLDYPGIQADHHDEVIGPLAHLSLSPEELGRMPFYYKSHIPMFRRYFRILDDYGIKYGTTASGVLTAAGAPLVRLQDKL